MEQIPNSTCRCSNYWRIIAYLSLLLSKDIDALTSISTPRQKIARSFLLSTATTSEQVLDSIRDEHDQEINFGASIFGNNNKSKAAVNKNQWSDKDFISHSLIEKGNAGPDEYIFDNGHKIFETVEPVVTADECNTLIAEAREVINKGLDENKSKDVSDGKGEDTPTNSELGEARVSQMPQGKEWLRHALQKRFFPLLESRFGIPAQDLTLQDSLIIGYGYFGQGSQSQPIHRDSSILSLNVALSTKDSFEVGGTFFEGLPSSNSVITTDQGRVLCHASGAQHAGRGISSGQRWVLVLFCLAKHQIQVARRCHARGIHERVRGNLEEADYYFKMGLSAAPNDHLLLSSLGSVQMERGNVFQAQCMLSSAALAYHYCPKANMALGKMMLESGLPRSALRRFDLVLNWLEDRDLQPDALVPLKAVGWDARFYGGHAAILCFLGAKKFGIEIGAESLIKANKGLDIALKAVPGDGRIVGMISKIDELLLELSKEQS